MPPASRSDASDLGLAEEAAALLGRRIPEEAIGRLSAFEALLAGRGAELGLISKGDVSRVRQRHILDSLRAASRVRPSDSTAYDLGSGGGLPGLVVAIAVPDLRVECVESRRNRAAFLELAIDDLGLGNAAVRLTRIEELEEPVDVCFSRALAGPEESWRLAEPLLRPGGRLIYFAGRGSLPWGDPGEGGSPRPEGLQIDLVPAPGLESAGPLVIMGRP